MVKGWAAIVAVIALAGLTVAVRGGGEERRPLLGDADGPRLSTTAPQARPAVPSLKLASRRATLPRGVRLVEQESDWRPVRDAIAGRLALPSGRIVSDGFPNGQSEPLDYDVPPGRYPVYVTLARPEHKNFDGVALATLVVSHTQPVRWRRIGGIGVDGGVAAFTSVEGARAL